MEKLKRGFTRADEKFLKDLEELKKRRYFIGKDKKLRGNVRITKAMTRHPSWKKFLKEIENAEFKD